MKIRLPEINKCKEMLPEERMFNEALKLAFEDAFYEGSDILSLLEKDRSCALFEATGGGLYKHLDFLCEHAGCSADVIRVNFKKFKNNKENFISMLKKIKEK